MYARTQRNEFDKKQQIFLPFPMTFDAAKEAASKSGFAGHAPSGLVQVRFRMRRCASEPINIVILIALMLALAGCDTRQYNAQEAETVLQIGREQMEGWIGSNCPQGELIRIENAVRKLPGGHEYLLPCVKGELSDGQEARDFFFNLEKNKVYLAPDSMDYRAFQKECLSYTMECLGINEPSIEEGDGENEAFFYISLITEMVEPDPKYGMFWGIDGYASSEYAKFPGELLLSGGSIQDYIRDPNRGDTILVELNARIPDNALLSSYTMERIKTIEGVYGLYFKNLHLESGADEIGIVWENDERVLDYDKKEDTNMNEKKGKGGVSEMEDSMEMWYEQSGRLARIRIRNLKGKTYLRYNLEGGRKETSWHGGEMIVQEEADGTYIYSIDMKEPFYPYIRYDPEEDILLAKDNEGHESIFKRTKFVPDADELQKKAEEYPAPDESFCGDWKGYPEEGSGDYRLSLGAPDASGLYQIDASFSFVSDNSGDGYAGLSVEIIDISAEAVLSDGVMMVSGSYNDDSSTPESERTMKAVLEQHNGGLRLIVLECKSFRIHPGDWLDLVRE